MWSKVFIFVFLSLAESSEGLKALIYSPVFAASHSNFMGRLSDTLTEAGHEVTVLIPVADVSRIHQHGVRLAKEKIFVMPNDTTSEIFEEPDHSHFWTETTDPSHILKGFAWFRDAMKEACENTLSRRELIEDLRNRSFDVAYIEPLAICGLALFEHLGIESVILTSSTVYYDLIPNVLGEPNEPSSVPAVFSDTPSEMSLIQRVMNVRALSYSFKFAQDVMEKEMEVYRRIFGSEMPHWKEMIRRASFHFTNANPFLDFPRLMLSKTVLIGGIAVDVEKIRAEKVSEEWDEVLNRRKKTVLISFGSLLFSRDMPPKAKQNFLEIIKSMPEVTFIWKYESNDTAWASSASNIYFSPWVPQTALLADSRLTAFVTHGGLGSTNELAYMGKPALTIPMFGDQPRNAFMLERHGGSVFIGKFDILKRDVIERALKEVLNNPKYARNARKLAEMLNSAPVKPKDLVLKYTEFAARFGRVPEMSPHSVNLNFMQFYFLDVAFLMLLISFFLFTCSNALKVLVYAPIFGTSHSNFMGKLADTLTEAKHSVTYLAPVADMSLVNRTGVKLTKNVILVKPEDFESDVSIKKADHSHFWTDSHDPSVTSDGFKWFGRVMQKSCQNTLSDSELLERLKAEKFDVAYAEPVVLCGVALFHYLKIEAVILTTSTVYFDMVPHLVGEPLMPSCLPSLFSEVSDEMTLLERLLNLRTLWWSHSINEELMANETLIYRHFLGEDVPTGTELLPQATFLFTNSNPYLDFPRPTLHKTIQIGGITLDMARIRSEKVSQELDNLLNLRKKSVLVSFGSMIASSEMPLKSKSNLLSIFKSMPEVTFIWKYEDEDTKWAGNVENVHFMAWVPQTALLADPRLSAFVSHGGLGSITEVAYSGKPAVTIPIFGDQPRNAQMLKKHGGSILINKFDMDNSEIVEKAIRSVLYEEKYSQSAKKLSEVLESAPLKPKELVLRYTEFAAKFGKLPNLDPYGRKISFVQYYYLDALFMGR
ncbi:unnamed protein product [Caenorhabditis auriculariae]|uniref:glucuronosyltransferase n=1 Tax=Caenorhabditis auriculariae TaxID=2777116 RepID=A0A8S1GT94_9PELO|nr:unnamed protein product [Caenorhabditis auriculariae]